MDHYEAVIHVSGATVLFDKEDLEIFLKHPWRFFAKYCSYKKNGKTLQFHNEIMKPPYGFIVDHINRNRLDNRRKNLRIVSFQQNAWNSSKYKAMNGRPCTSKFRGVSFRKDRQKFRATINVNKKQKCLGMFSSEEEAARAFDRADLEYHGPYANLNFPKV